MPSAFESSLDHASIYLEFAGDACRLYRKGIEAGSNLFDAALERGRAQQDWVADHAVEHHVPAGLRIEYSEVEVYYVGLSLNPRNDARWLARRDSILTALRQFDRD